MITAPRALRSALMLLLAAGCFAAVFAPHARASEAGMDFPRQMLDGYLAGDTAQVWAHASPMLRELAESEQGLRAAVAEMTEGMGDPVEMLGEQLFDHPEGGGAKVYVRAVRHSQVPEMFWIVTFFPAAGIVQMIMPQPRQTIRTLFPQVELP